MIRDPKACAALLQQPHRRVVNCDKVHSRQGLFRATDATFAREAEAFLHFREKKTGERYHHAALSWEEFKREMSEFMAEMKTRRGPLLQRQYNPILQVHKDL